MKRRRFAHQRVLVAGSQQRPGGHLLDRLKGMFQEAYAASVTLAMKMGMVKCIMQVF